MTHEPLSYEVIEHGTPTYAIIGLHGLGADGHDFAGIARSLQLPTHIGIRFICPHAPMRSVTANAGMLTRAWYDIKHINLLEEEDEAGIKKSAQAVERLIQIQLDAGIRANRIILAGFSQGGAIALHVGLRYQQRLAGVLALSTYLPLPHQLQAQFNASQAQLPIMMAHGLYDPIVPLVLAQRSKTMIEASVGAIDWQSFPMLHQIIPLEMMAINNWLRNLIGQT